MARSRSKRKCGSRSHFDNSTSCAAWNMSGYFQRLVFPSVTEKYQHFRGFAQIEPCGQNQIAHVFDQQHAVGQGGQIVQGVVHHAGVQVAALPVLT